MQAEFRIALSYGVFAALWFVFSHQILLLLFGENGLQKLDMFGDITFGLISSALIYSLVRRSSIAQERVGLRELEHLTEFQQFFGGSIEYAMFSLDANGLVRTWDTEAARMHGFTTNQVLNKPVKQCFAIQESWNPEDLFKKAQLTGKATHLGWLSRQDGFRYWGDVNFEQIQLPDEQVAYLVITRNLNGSRGIERFNSMIESMTEGLIVIDREWRFAFVNSNGAKLLERDAADLIGKNVWLEYPALLGSEFGLACRKAMDQNISTIIDDFTSTSTRWLENRIYPSPDGILIFYSDVTEKHHAQEAIRINEQRLRMVLLAGQQSFFDIDLRSSTVTSDVYQVSGFPANNLQKTGVQPLEDWYNQIYPDDRTHVLEELNAFVSGNRAEYWVEYRWKMADGSWRWKLSQGAILEHDETGQSVRMLGTQIDIQSFKAIEQALQTSNKRYLKLMEASPVAIFEANSNGETVYVNARWQEITGYNRFLAMNQGWSTTLHPEDRPGVLAAWKEAVDGQKAYAHEYRFQHADGTTRWVYGLAEPLKDQNGNVTGYLGSMVDLTERKRAEQKLEQSEKMFRLLSENSSDMISLTNLQGVKQYVSPAVNQILGYSVEEFLTLPSADWQLEHDPQKSSETQGRLLRGESTLEIERYRARRKDGAIIWLEVSARMVMNPITNQMDEIQTSARDITKKIEIQQALEASEYLYRTITENSHDVTLIVGLDSLIQYVSPAVKPVLGFEPVKLRQTQAISYIHPDDLEQYLVDRRKAIEHGQDVFRSKTRTRCNDGGYIWTESVIKIIRDTTGNVTELQITLHDINEQVMAQEKLETSERLYRAMTENSHDVIFITNLDATILYVSPSVKTLSGFEPEEMFQTPIMDYFHPDDLQKHLESRREAFEKGLNIFRSESRLRRKDGEYIWVESILKIKRDEHGKVQELQVSSRDMTERIVAQEKLEASEHLYRTITENTRDIIAIFALDGKITYVSPSIKAVLGYEEKYIKSKTVSEFIHPEDIEKFNRNLENTIESKNDFYTFEVRALHQNGTYIWVETSGKIIRNLNGMVIEIQSTTRDIQERVTSRIKLEQSEYLYRNITENAHDITLITHTDSSIQYVSPSVKTILGFDPEEIMQTRSFDYFHPADLESYDASRRAAIKNGLDIFRANARLRRKNGDYIWVELVVKISRNAEGSTTELQVTVRSIDDWKLAQEKLEESERLYRTITENAYDVIVVTDIRGVLRYVSPSATTVFGYVQEEGIEVMGLNSIHPHDLNAYLQIRQEALDQHKAYFNASFRARHHDGHYIWVESISKLIRDHGTGTLIEIQSTVRDIGERMIALQKLEESERLYRTITENAQDVIVISNIDGKVRFLSPSAKLVLGYDESEFDKLSNFNTMHPEDKDAYLKIRREAIENRKEDFKSTYRVRQKNGNYVWIESRAKLIRDRDTQVLIELQSTLRDISERVVALQKLEENERLYRTITENAQDVIVVSTADRQLRYVSPSASTVFGYDQSNIANMLSVESMHPDDQIAYLALRQDAVNKHKDHLSTIFRVKHQNGDYIWVETLSKFIYDPETKELREIQATLRDVTSRKTAQDALEQLNIELEQRVEERTKRLFEVNQELESFTSSVSHDLRSPLNVIQGFGRAFLEDYSDTTPSAGQDFVNRIVGAAGRMDVLITDLLQYSRLSKAEVRLTPIALEQMLLNLVHEFESERERRNAIIKLKGNFPSVLARETILRQILINLVGNSLKFSRSDTSPEITIWAEIERHSQMIKIHVQDNGIGIETRDLERIFQPFERLHGVSEYPGSGIGLAFVKRGIERMGGQIGVTSTLGKGSHFWLLLNKPREMT